jgi:signal peptidase I
MADRDDPRPDAPADDGERLFTSSSQPPYERAEGTAAESRGWQAGGAGRPDEPGPSRPVGDEGRGAGTPRAGGEADHSPRPRRADERHRRAKAKKAGSFWRELPVLLLIAFLLAFLLRTFVLQVFYIPSSSMEPTLQIDDRMVVEKLTYLVREPERGEVVVFEGETFVDPYGDQGTVSRVVRGVGQFLGVVPASARDFVKRVIGVEGDEVVIENGQVFVNGEALDEPYVVFDDGSDYGPVTVPEGHLFFLGDNRPNSSDSRRSLGFVPLDHVVGRAAVIIWPPDHAGGLTGTTHDVPDPGASADDEVDRPTDDEDLDDAA